MVSLFNDEDFVPFDDDELDLDLEALALYEDDEYDSFEQLRAFDEDEDWMDDVRHEEFE